MWWIGLLILVIFIVIVALLVWRSNKVENPNGVDSRDSSREDRIAQSTSSDLQNLIQPSSIVATTPTSMDRNSLPWTSSNGESFSQNPLAGSNNPTNRIVLSKPDNPWIGSACNSDVFDGKGAVCSNGKISATYYSVCDGSIPCQAGSVCLNGVCTPLDITELNGHPFQIREDRAMLYPSWQMISNVLDICSTPEVGKYLFICSQNNNLQLLMGNDLVDGEIRRLNFPHNITSFKRMALINHSILSIMVPWLTNSDPKITYMISCNDLIWYLILDLDKQLYLVNYRNNNGDYILNMSEQVNFPLSIDMSDFNNCGQAFLMISDTCSYLITIQNGEVFAESFEGCLAGAISGTDHLCLIVDNQLNYYYRTNEGWEKFILNSQFKQVEFLKPWFVVLLAYDCTVYKYQLLPELINDPKFDDNFVNPVIQHSNSKRDSSTSPDLDRHTLNSVGSCNRNVHGVAAWIKQQIKSVRVTSLSNGIDHVYAISGRVGLLDYQNLC